MTHQQIHESVAPGTTLFSVSCGRVLKANFKLTEVHTNYTGERTYYTVLEEEHSKQTWVDHGANEWFLTKEEAVKWGIASLEKRINEWQKQMIALKKEL
jgi:hypothetical protein